MSEVFPLPPRPDSLNSQLSPEQLHIIKNGPNILPPGYVFPPYVFVQFPQAIYKRKDDSNEVESRNVHSQAELDDYLDKGWSEKPDFNSLKAAGQRYINKMAALEGHRNYEDRNMSAAAKAEIDAEQDNREDFLVEMPQAPLGNKRRGWPKGKPRKTTTEPEGA